MPENVDPSVAAFRAGWTELETSIKGSLKGLEDRHDFKKIFSFVVLWPGA